MRGWRGWGDDLGEGGGAVGKGEGVLDVVERKGGGGEEQVVRR